MGVQGLVKILATYQGEIKKRFPLPTVQSDSYIKGNAPLWAAFFDNYFILF